MIEVSLLTRCYGDLMAVQSWRRQMGKSQHGQFKSGPLQKKSPC